MKNSILRQKTFAFAVKIVRLVQRLQSVHKEFILSTQILKSGTSPGGKQSGSRIRTKYRRFRKQVEYLPEGS